MIAPVRRPDPVPLSAGQRDQVAESIGYAKRIARRLTAGAPWLREEAEAVALEALCGAAARHDPRRGVPFPDSAARRIAGSVRDLKRRTPLVGRLRSGALRPSVYPLDATAEVDEEGFPRTYADLIPARPGPDAVAAADAFAALLAHLEPMPRCLDLFQFVYGQGLTVEEAGRRLGVRARRAYALHAAGLARLRRVPGLRRRW